jgi:hypothetical protein
MKKKNGGLHPHRLCVCLCVCVCTCVYVCVRVFVNARVSVSGIKSSLESTNIHTLEIDPWLLVLSAERWITQCSRVMFLCNRETKVYIERRRVGGEREAHQHTDMEESERASERESKCVWVSDW